MEAALRAAGTDLLGALARIAPELGRAGAARARPRARAPHARAGATIKVSSSTQSQKTWSVVIRCFRKGFAEVELVKLNPSAT